MFLKRRKSKFSKDAPGYMEHCSMRKTKFESNALYRVIKLYDGDSFNSDFERISKSVLRFNFDKDNPRFIDVNDEFYKYYFLDGFDLVKIN